MKKLFLLLAGSAIALNADAQYAKNIFNSMSRKQAVMQDQSGKATLPEHQSSAKTTASCFTTVETFGTGTTSTLPTGWTTGIITGTGTWKWANTASTSTYSMGVMNSSSADDGWMIFDSDGIGAACGASCIPAGWLQSPAYDCSAQSSVRLTFENFYRNFYDSCFVWVSTDPLFGSGNYTVFPVLLNKNTPVNSSTGNPSTVKINISSVAANQAAVYVRFVYTGYAGGSYSWMIDNVCLSDVDAHDVSISNSFLVMPDADNSALQGSLFTTPLAFVDSVYPLSFLGNAGAAAENSVSTTATIYKGTASVYTDNYTYPVLPLDAADSVIGFGGYKPTSTGNYVCVLSTTLSGDADMTNNVDSVFFNVTDTLWQQNKGTISGTFLYRSSPAVTYMQGTRFDVPSTSPGDTITGFGVSFNSSSMPTGTGTVSVQLYSVQRNSTAWTYLGTSVSRSLTATDYSSAGNIVWADFRIDKAASGGVAPFILEHGYSYAAIVQINGVSADLLLNSTPALRGSDLYIGYLGQLAESTNDGSPSFGADLMTGNGSSVPMIRVYTTGRAVTGVENVTYINAIGKAYPNPANTSVNIPFTISRDGVVTVTLSNVVGQVLKSQQVNARGGQQATTTFATNDLPAGVYVYTVEINGEHTTGRISVTH